MRRTVDIDGAVAVQIGALTAGLKAAGVVVRRRGGEAGQHEGQRGLHDGAAYERAQPIEDSCIFEDVADLAGRGGVQFFCVCDAGLGEVLQGRGGVNGVVVVVVGRTLKKRVRQEPSPIPPISLFGSGRSMTFQTQPNMAWIVRGVRKPSPRARTAPIPLGLAGRG